MPNPMVEYTSAEPLNEMLGIEMPELPEEFGAEVGYYSIIAEIVAEIEYEFPDGAMLVFRLCPEADLDISGVYGAEFYEDWDIFGTETEVDTYENMFVALGRDYYKKAVEHIKERVSDPRFFIFSDDCDFVRDEFTWLDNKCVVSGNEGDSSYLDMQLMSLCKHNIIANSTFSQWGALLNNNEDHITVYPRAYLKERDNEVKNFKGWIRL